MLLKFELVKILKQKSIYIVYGCLAGITLFNVSDLDGPASVVTAVNPEITGIMLLLGLSAIFTQEYSSNVDNYLLSTKKGRREAVWAKIGAALLYAFAVVLIFELISIAVNGRASGNGRWQAALQSLPSYSASLYELSILDFHLLQLGIHLLGACSFALLIILISAVSKNSFIAFVVGAFILFGPVLEFVDNIAVPWVIELLPFVYYNILQVQPFFTEPNAVEVLGVLLPSSILASLLMVVTAILFIAIVLKIMKYKEISV